MACETCGVTLDPTFATTRPIRHGAHHYCRMCWPRVRAAIAAAWREIAR